MVRWKFDRGLNEAGMSETCAESMDFEEGGRRAVSPGKRGRLGLVTEGFLNEGGRECISRRGS